jgi:beta-phosphoglucomutase family hydrolase
MNPKNNQLRAVLWDMDGTLIDSMPYHWRAWQDILRQINRHVEHGVWNQTVGMRNSEIIPLLFPDMSAEQAQYVDRAKEERYRERIEQDGIDLLPGVAEWLQRFQAAGWRQAVASSAPPENVATIAHVLRLNGAFGVMISGADVQRGKPDPDIFLAAAQRLNAAPQNCLVIEDAANGVEAAHRAGMKAIGVLNTQSHLEADVVVRSLHDLTWEMIEDLLRDT